MMTAIIFTTIVFGFLSYFYSKQIRKYAFVLYGIAAFISLIIDSKTANIFSYGYVPYGIFILVMYMGILDKGKFKNQLLNVRGELAIIGTILLFPHVYGYLEYYLIELGFIINPVPYFIGIASVVLLLPLALTSFRKIRSKLGYKTWKRIHYLSYIFYILIALHVILLANTRLWYYIIIFSVYIILKGYMLIIKPQAKKIETPVKYHKATR